LAYEGELQDLSSRDRWLPNDCCHFFVSFIFRFRGSSIDLGRDVGQTFIVDGDSLLLDAFSNPLLDWSRGGQFLHLTFIIESFLER
jgi:hypothetical protein